MRFRSSKNSIFFELQRSLAFFALMFLALMPQGFMLDTSLNKPNSIAIVICNAQGEFDAFMDTNGNITFDIGEQSNKKHDNNPNNIDNNQHCSFAGFANSGLINAPVEFVKSISTLPQRPIILPDFSVAIGHGLAAPPPPKTGPPILI